MASTRPTGGSTFPSSERSAIGTDLYRIRLDGTGFTRLSQPLGTHRAIFNPAFTHYVGIWSDVTTPPQVRLHRADGTEVRVIDANPVRTHAQFQLSKPEFVQVPARDGFVMDAMIIRPPDFNPARRYPVFQHTYAGPGAAQVRNQWGGQTYMFHQMLAQHGVIVWIHDNRSASGKGVRVAVAGLRQSGRTGAARPGRRHRVAEEATGRRRLAPPPERMELRRVHDGVRADAQHELGGRHRRGARDRLARLRHGLHRAPDEDAAAQPGRLSARRRPGSPPTGSTAACC